MRTVFVIFLLIERLFCKDTTEKLKEMLKSDRHFYDQWMHLVELQVIYNLFLLLYSTIKNINF